MLQNVVTFPKVVSRSEVVEWSRMAEKSADRRIWLSRDPNLCEQCLSACSPKAEEVDGLTNAPVVVLTHRDDPARQSSFLNAVSPTAALIAASCEEDVAVGLSISGLQKIGPAEASTVDGLVVALSETEQVSFQGVREPTSERIRRPPALTTIGIVPRDPMIRRLIERDVVARPNTATSDTGPAHTERMAIRAGLLLLAGFIDESHAASQSIEGKGLHRSGDYWHAILHRREPDYGNAKYWFRSVGRHPNYVEMSHLVRRMLNQASPLQVNELTKWESRLTSANWEPAAFVDLCQAAENNLSLQIWCEEIQFREMLLLMMSTYREAVEN